MDAASIGSAASSVGSNDRKLRQRSRRLQPDNGTASRSASPDLDRGEMRDNGNSNLRRNHSDDVEDDESLPPPPSLLSASTNQTSIFETNIPRLSVALLASMTTGGTVYAFGLYGNALKKNLHLTQSQLDTISTALFCAGTLSWVPGLLVDHFGTRFGISAGSTIGAIALMMYWHVSHHGLDKDEDGNSLWFGMSMSPHHGDDFSLGIDSSSSSATKPNWLIVPTLSALGVTVFLSCALVTGSVFKIIVNSCGPGTKGSAVGVAKGYVGLGAGAYACFFESIRQPYTSDLEFLPMAAVFFMVAGAIPSWLILPSKRQEKERLERQRTEQQRQQINDEDLPPGKIPDVTTPTHFRVLFSSLIGMACIIVGNSLITLYDSSSDRHHKQANKQNNSEDDDMFADDDLALFDKLQQESLSNSTEGPNYPLAALLLLVWWAPIVSLYYLPQGTPHLSSVTMLDEEQEDLLGESDASNTAAVASSYISDGGGDEQDNLNPSSNVGILTDRISTKQGSYADAPLNDFEGDVGNVSDSEFSSELEHIPSDPGRENDDDGNKNLLQMLSTPTAWLMLWTTTILVGGGTVETNNLGQMVESLDFPDVVTPAALALFSVAQSLSRAVTGATSESALNWNTRKCTIDNGVPRPVFLIIASIAGFVAHGLLAVSTNLIPFVLGVFLSGIAFGMVWPLMVLIVGEVWGTAHVAANYMFFDGFTSAGGTLLLSKLVAQEVYERHIVASSLVPPTDVDTSAISMEKEEALIEAAENPVHGTELDADIDGLIVGDAVTCYGQDCFQMTHFVVSALSLLCVLTSVGTLYTTRHVYNRSTLHRH